MKRICCVILIQEKYSLKLLFEIQMKSLSSSSNLMVSVLMCNFGERVLDKTDFNEAVLSSDILITKLPKKMRKTR